MQHSKGVKCCPRFASYCVYCHKPFGQIKWLDHRPALLDTNLKTLQWDEVPAELLQAFRRQHPDLAVDRPGKREE